MVHSMRLPQCPQTQLIFASGHGGPDGYGRRTPIDSTSAMLRAVWHSLQRLSWNKLINQDGYIVLPPLVPFRTARQPGCSLDAGTAIGSALPMTLAGPATPARPPGIRQTPAPSGAAGRRRSGDLATPAL